MNAVTLEQTEQQIASLERLVRTNDELFNDGVLSKSEYRRNKKALGARLYQVLLASTEVK